MADQFADAEYAALYPNSPSAGVRPQPALSSYPPRRAAQIQFPATPAAWPAEPDHAGDLKALSDLLATTAKQYPRSVLTLCAPEIGAAIGKANADIRAIDAAIAAGTE